MYIHKLFLLLFFLVASFYTSTLQAQRPALSLQPLDWQYLPGWKEATPSHGLTAFKKSCDKIGLKNSGRRLKNFWHKPEQWEEVCEALHSLPSPLTDNAARYFMELFMKPYQVHYKGEPTGKYTGYFAYGLRASEKRGGIYQHPIYALPNNVVRRGDKWLRKTNSGKLVPYYTRAEIYDGAIKNNAKVLYWAADPVDVFFLHVQGSGEIELPNGERRFVGFDGRNGHKFTGVGRVLVSRGDIKLEGASMQSIRKWLRGNPKEGDKMMRKNESFIFFRKLEGGPVGAMGVEVTPTRSMAGDPAYWPYGLPIWVGIGQLNRMMVIQDTGADIKGGIRGDFYWGAGADAEMAAGRMNYPGTMYAILPRSLGEDTKK